MNLGTLFSKPGESSYSVYRRFLISNHTIKYKDLTGELRKHFSDVFGSDYLKNSGWISIPKMILMLEGKKNKREINFNGFKGKKIDYSNGPSKHCSKCASIGYHSNLYELEWIKRCPIHNKTLVRYCPACWKRWPSTNDFKKNLCSCCGIKVKLTSILDNFELNKKIYKRINTYLKQLSKHKKLKNNYLFFHGNKLTKTFSGVNKISVYSIEALKSFRLINENNYKKCIKLYKNQLKPVVESYHCEELKKYELREYVSNISDYRREFDLGLSDDFLKKIDAVKQRVTINFSALISKQQSPGFHQIGEECNYNKCYSCNIWKEWLRLIFPVPSQEYSFKDPENYYRDFKIPELVTHVVKQKFSFNRKSYAQYNGFHRASEITRLKNYSKLRVFKISELLSLKLYEIELWICANVILNKHCLKAPKSQLQLFEAFSDKSFHGSSKYHIQFMAIFLNINSKNNKIELSYPEDILNTDIFESYYLSKLIRESNSDTKFYMRPNSRSINPI